MDVYTVMVDMVQGIVGIVLSTQPPTRGLTPWTPATILQADAIAKSILTEPMVRENGNERRYASMKGIGLGWSPVK